MPRIYNQGEFISPSGWKARQAAAAARAAAEAARRNDPARIEVAAQRRAIIEADRLREVLSKAKAHRVTLVTNLNTAISKAAEMDEESYIRGIISDSRPRVQNQIDRLPAMIARAEAEIVAAQQAVEAHLAAQQPDDIVEPIATTPVASAPNRRADR